MEITLLGSGDAIGTPKIGCACETCTSARDRGWSRLRSSILVSAGGKNILIDTSPDLRQQLLLAGSPRIDAVIWTHGHYDHFIGYGEFYRVQGMPPVYAAPGVLDYCGRFFRFLPFEKVAIEPYSAFDLMGVEVTFFEMNHPSASTYGVRIDAGDVSVASTSDTRRDVCQRSMDLMEGADLLFVDAMVPAGYSIYKHMNYPEACSLARETGAADFRCIHMSHLILPGTPHAGRDMESFHL